MGDIITVLVDKNGVLNENYSQDKFAKYTVVGSMDYIFYFEIPKLEYFEDNVHLNYNRFMLPT